MSEIDRERIEGVRTLRRLGYVFREGQWVGPEPGEGLISPRRLTPCIGSWWLARISSRAASEAR